MHILTDLGHSLVGLPRILLYCSRQATVAYLYCAIAHKAAVGRGLFHPPGDRLVFALLAATTSRLPDRQNWYPVAFFPRDENGEIGEILGALLGDIWEAWLHVRTLAVAAPVRGMALARIHEALPNLMRLSPVAPKVQLKALTVCHTFAMG
jgi:hypothetical protein